MSSMRFARIALLLMFGMLSLLGYAQENIRLATASLLDPANNSVRLDLPEKKAVVLMIMAVDCPITQKYVPTIEDVHESFGPRVEFLGIFPHTQSAAEVAAFIKEYKISVPCYIDHEGTIIELLGATMTPEVFLLSPTLSLLYSGAIDNWFYKLGSYRTKVSKHYLADAIRDHLSGNEIITKRTEAIGCPIPEREDSTPSGTHSHH